MACNVILVDDHAALRGGIKSYLLENSDFQEMLEAGSFPQFEEIKSQFENDSLKPDDFVAVVDISFKSENQEIHHEENIGFEIIKIFSSLGIKCIAFSSHDSGGFIQRALEVGAKGFVSKNAEEKVLLEAIKTVQKGKTYIEADLITNLLEVQNIAMTFTKKEKYIADALSIYKTNPETAKELGISEKTLCNYLTILYDKTGTENKIQLLEKLGRI